MKKLSDLIKSLDIVEKTGNTAIKITSLAGDSRDVMKDSLFVARKGGLDDGNNYINEAIKKGAKAIVHEHPGIKVVPNITYIRVSDSSMALAQIANNFYDNPSKKLKLVGVTGTNGKTTTATLLYKLFRLFGYNVALLSTIENKINEKVYKTTHTTPDPIKLNSFLALAVSKNCQYAFMECSSHAIDQKRIWGLHFAGAIFTNLTQDHLDYHKTLGKYAEAKKGLFDMLPKTAFALGNLDDKKSKYLLSDTKAKKYFFGINNQKGEFSGKIIKQSLDETTISINDEVVKTNLIGKFNTYNILGIFATAKLLGIKKTEIVKHLNVLKPPKGRLEFIKSKKGIYGVVDYSHTPDALENALKTLREISGDNKIITVVGCGGDRDKTKRPIMGNIACKLSDYVIFTSDNPRTENPKIILEDITKGLPRKIKNYESLVDRKKAITLACVKAKTGDIVLVAGKGHEDYQIFKNKTIHFSDMEILTTCFKNK